MTTSTSDAGGLDHSRSTDAQGAPSDGGGIAGYTLSVEEVAPHVHGYIAAIHTSGGGVGLTNGSRITVNSQDRATGAMGSGGQHAHGIVSDGTHAHNVSVSAVADNRHTAPVTDGRPPFYVLAVILKL